MTETLPKVLENDYYNDNVKIDLYQGKYGCTVEIIEGDKRICYYEYEIIDGLLNIGFSDPNWYEIKKKIYYESKSN